jgi:two-component system, NarL family, sensor kinase
MALINRIRTPADYAPDHRMSRYWIGLFTFSISVMVLIGFGLGILAVLASKGEMNPFTHLFLLPFITAVYGIIGVLLATQYPRNAISWLILLVAFFSALTLMANALNAYTRYGPVSNTDVVSDFAIWLDKWVWWIPTVVPLTHILLLFPDGRLPSPRWQVVSWLAGAGLVAAIVATALHPGELPQFGLPDPNPYGIANAAQVLEFLLNLASMMLLIGILGSIAAVFMRFRRATGRERGQLKWLVYAAALTITALTIVSIFWLADSTNPFLLEMGIMVSSTGVTLLIVAIGCAILQLQLWDIDMLMNRTLVYGLLTVIVAGMYILTVSFLSVLFEGDNLVFSLVATGVVAVSFHPLRDTLQRWINRLLFGDRDDPYKVLKRLSQQLETVWVANEMLPTIVETIAHALRLPYVAIALRHDGYYRVVAAYPSLDEEPRQDNTQIFPLIHGSETIGRIVLEPRGLDEQFSSADYQLLDMIVHQVSIAAYNVRLTAELQRSRERLVTALEDERRRLRRDLHDGLGPVLASMSFRLDAASNFVRVDPDQACQLLTDLKAQVQSSLSEIRRIAYNLRPPALDELGLLGALREYLVSMHQHQTLKLIFDAPGSLPPLSAAVEVAVYRIVLEAVTNVQRHAAAKTCTVRITVNEKANVLSVEIMDDGCGIASTRSIGVGLTAIHERTSELGGRCRVEPLPRGGTRVLTMLPLPNEYQKEN